MVRFPADIRWFSWLCSRSDQRLCWIRINILKFKITRSIYDIHCAPQYVQRAGVEVDTNERDALADNVIQRRFQPLHWNVVLVHSDSQVLRWNSDVLRQRILQTTGDGNLKIPAVNIPRYLVFKTWSWYLLALMTFGSKEGNSTLASGEQE